MAGWGLEGQWFAVRTCILVEGAKKKQIKKWYCGSSPGPSPLDMAGA